MEEEQKTTNILVIWRGQKFNVEANPGVTLKEFGQKLQQLTNVKSDTIRLLVPRSHDNSSKLLSPFSDEHSSLRLQESSLLEGKSVRMMGVFEDEIEEVSRNITKADMRIAGFDEEERRLRQRMLSGPKTPLKLPQGAYIFCDFRTLHIPGIELHPPASEALRRMHMLAADPGIVAIMNKHRWRVGIMTEMAPVGYVGVSPKCILGFNKNHGEEISLRLRTDDLKGFRKYESIKKTLLHELAHMVYSEHDADFFALDSQLNKEAANLDWTKSRSHTLSGLRPSDYFEEEYDIETGSSISQKLGGHTSDQLATARASSVAAAYRRLADASAKHEIHAEPDPDDYERLPDHSILKENLQVEHPREACIDRNWELDQKNIFENQNKFQNQNGSLGNEAMDVETYLGINGDGITAEPDPDDSEMAESTSHSRPNGLSFGAKICAEPDPDDCKANRVTVKNRMAESDPDDSVISKKANGKARVGGFVEPDPDDSQAADIAKDTAKVNKTKEEPDPDESSMEIAILGRESNAEPDPDDSLANGLMHEPDPDDSIKGSVEPYNGQNDEPSSDDPELRRIQDPVAVVCTRLQKAIDTLKSEVNPMEATSALQTLFKIIRNVIEHPNEAKFKRLRKANPQFQRNVANYKAAIEVLHLVGFNEDTVSDEIGRSETYMVLKRNDPGLLWLAKSSLEMCIAY